MTAGPCGSLAKFKLIIHRQRNNPPWRSEAEPLYEDGGRGKWAVRSFSGWLVGGLHPAAGDERVQVERPQPRSGEDDDLDAR